jgi:uncharacterized protein (DUF2147 family)
MVPMLSALLLAAAPATGDSAVGRWRTEVNNSVVEIARCGPSICGRILTSAKLRTQPDLKDAKNSNAALRNRPLKGLQILSGFTWDDDAWTGGKIYNAEDGRTYNAKVTPVGADQLKLRGCVVFPLCKTQTWTRVR